MVAPPDLQTSLTAKIYGFDDQKKKIVESLQRGSLDGFKAIGIVGMGGSGKTALAQWVFNSRTVKKEFRPRIWVSLSQTLDEQVDVKKKIAEQMLEELGEEEYESGTNANLEEKLLLTLQRHLSGKKYLIVLDGIWRISAWIEHLGSKLLHNETNRGDRFTYGLPKGNGGGVIVTSRLQEVATSESVSNFAFIPRELLVNI